MFCLVRKTASGVTSDVRSDRRFLAIRYNRHNPTLCVGVGGGVGLEQFEELQFLLVFVEPRPAEKQSTDSLKHHADV